MLQHTLYKCIEFVILYLIFPILFFLHIIPLKFLMPVLIGFGLYTFFILKITYHSFTFSNKLNFRFILIRFFLLSLIFLLLSYLYFPQTFFYMVMNESKLFLLVIVLYPFLSVIPQELLYREFFFKRYAFKLHTNTQLVLNAFLFMWAHIVFGNSVVLVLTFIAGLLFAHTYIKNRSFLLVCVEHTLYGYLLFVSGLGELFFQSGTLSALRAIFSQ